MLRYLFSFLLLLMTLNSFAQSDYVVGEGHFYSLEDDSLDFVKEQLVFSSFLNVISKEMKIMGLDSDLFLKKFDEKFEKNFAPVQASMDASKKDEFEKQLRIKKLSLKSQFGDIGSSIKSYSIKSMTKSTENPNSRFMSILAKTERKYIKALYYKFTKEGQGRFFSQFYITLNFSLENMTWNDLGVQSESDFSSALKESWQKWFSTNLEGVVGTVVLADEAMQAQLSQQYVKNSERTENGQGFFQDSKESLWARINIRISKVSDETQLKNRVFRIGGGFIIFDMKNNGLFSFFDIPDEIHSFSYEKIQVFSSSVASLIYRTPLEEFGNLRKKIEALPVLGNKVEIEVTNVLSVQDLLSINELLASSGVPYQFNPSMKKYNGATAGITLLYQGTEQNVISVLSTFKNKKIRENISIDYNAKEKPFSLVLKVK